MKAVIFDFDGTIVDTETLWVDVYTDLIQKKYNHSVPLEIFNACIGTTDETLYDYLTTNVDSTISRELLAPLAEGLVGEKLTELQPREGVVELLQHFKNENLRIAISSGSQRKWIDLFLSNHNLQHFFEEIRCADDVKNVKPHPELYLAALNALNLNADSCFAIEDSVNGSASALAANLTCFVYPNEITASSTFSPNVILVNAFSDIPKKLTQL